MSNDQLVAFRTEVLAAATRKRMTEGAKLLADAGVKTSALAYRSGVSAALVSHWLRGYRKPPAKFFAAVQELAGQQVADELKGILEEPQPRTALVAAMPLPLDPEPPRRRAVLKPPR